MHFSTLFFFLVKNWLTANGAIGILLQPLHQAHQVPVRAIDAALAQRIDLGVARIELFHANNAFARRGRGRGRA